MRTSVIEVRDMLSVLSTLGLEKRIADVPGVESVTVNYDGGNATVRYDETRLNIADIKSDVRQMGHESAVPNVASAGNGHENRATPSAPPTTPALAASKSPPNAAPVPPTSAPPTGNEQQNKAAPDAAATKTGAAGSKRSPAAAPASAVPKSAKDAAASSASAGPADVK